MLFEELVQIIGTSFFLKIRPEISSEQMFPGDPQSRGDLFFNHIISYPIWKRRAGACNDPAQLTCLPLPWPGWPHFLMDPVCFWSHLISKHTSSPVCDLLQMHPRCLASISFHCTEFRTTPEGNWNAFCILFKPTCYSQSSDSRKIGEFVSQMELSLGSTNKLKCFHVWLWLNKRKDRMFCDGPRCSLVKNATNTVPHVHPDSHLDRAVGQRLELELVHTRPPPRAAFSCDVTLRSTSPFWLVFHGDINWLTWDIS